MSILPDEDLLVSYRPVVVGSTTVYVDKNRPVAVIVSPEGATTFATWPDAPLPPQVGAVDVLSSPRAVWVIYAQEGLMYRGEDRIAAVAVRVGIDGSAASFDLGPLHPVGADDDGIWLTPKESPDIDLGDDERREDAEQDLVEEPLPSDTPLEEWEDIHPPRRAPDELYEISEPGSPEAEGLGWYIALEPGEEPPPEPPAMEPLAPTPPESVALLRRGPDGTELSVEFDHLVDTVEMADDRLRVTYYLSGPIGTPGPLGSMSFDYPRAVADIDVSSRVPASIRLNEWRHTLLPPEDWDDEIESQWAPYEWPRIDLARVPRTRWTIFPLEEEIAGSAIESVRADLRALDMPNTVWTSKDNARHLVRSDYRDLAVDVKGDWPETVETATFRYREHGDRLFRFRVPVFDTSGRPRVSEFLTLGLMEDLDTLDLDDVTVSPDDFIDITPQFTW